MMEAHILGIFYEIGAKLGCDGKPPHSAVDARSFLSRTFFAIVRGLAICAQAGNLRTVMWKITDLTPLTIPGAGLSCEGSSMPKVTHLGSFKVGI